jgi:hypothetical protein
MTENDGENTRITNPKASPCRILNDGQHDHHSALDVLRREQSIIVAAIDELRERARKVSIEASVTRRHVEDAEKDFWRDGIAKLQAELLEVQAKIAATNKELRKAKAAQPLKTLSQLPRGVAVKSEPPGRKGQEHNGEVKPGRILYLEFFLQICAEGLDPRQFAAFESGAHQLVDEFRKTHGKEEAS